MVRVIEGTRSLSSNNLFFSAGTLLHLEPLRAELGYLPGAREAIDEALRDAPCLLLCSAYAD